MDFWKSALEAAEKAKSMAKAVSQKGMELAEATAEEAGKKLKDLGLHDSVGTGSPAPAAPAPQELAAYGITLPFADYVRSLNYATFRDFPAEQLPPGEDGTPSAATLNPWQARHAGLVVRAVGEVNELRYVLCPRYMTDQRFWAVYFTLVRKHLPEAAAAWAPGDELPPVAADAAGDAGDEGFMSLAGIGGQLRTLSTRLQAAAMHSGGPAGLELASFLPGSSSASAPASGYEDVAGGEAAQPTGSAAGSAGGGAMLQADPELDAFLQVGPGGGGSGSERSAGGSRVDGEEEELDLDEYLNELSAEVGEQGEGGDGEDEDGGEDAVDVDAALRELAEQEKSAAAAAAAAAGGAR